MNKKLVNELAIGIIVFIALTIGGIFWLNSAKEVAQLNMTENYGQASMIKKPIMQKNNNQPINEGSGKDMKDSDCKPHYYEGEAGVDGWFISESDDGIIVAIKKDDIAKLPNIASSSNNEESNLTVKLIDSTKKVENEIKASSEKKPATFKIQGYAEICEQPPLVSLQPATIAFKQRS